jgi:crotonobetainyl-CoA:carnitine CoA-transferase CaiB-like acyl-CoA transferase
VGLLDGVRVLDFGRYVTGPYCAALLGDLGADVVRVERLVGGEDRYLGPVADDDSGALFLQSNRNKRGIALDMSAPEAAPVVRRLIAWADVLVANLPPAGLAKLGLDEDSVRAINPEIVLTTVDTFGPTGPYAGRVGFDGVAQVFAGSAYLSGSPEGPSKSYLPWADFLTAAFAALGTVAALSARRDHGQGQHVEASLLRTALTVSSGSLIEQAVRKLDRTPIGNRSYGSAPSDIYPTRDGHVLVQVIGPVQFKRWADLLGEPEWLTDPRFANDELRVVNADPLNDRMRRWCVEQTTEQALEILDRVRIPSAPVLRPQEVLEDPHVVASGLLESHRYSQVDVPLCVAPFGLSRDDPAITRSAPRLGEHTVEVLREVGVPQDELDRLLDVGAIRATPAS